MFIVKWRIVVSEQRMRIMVIHNYYTGVCSGRHYFFNRFDQERTCLRVNNDDSVNMFFLIPTMLGHSCYYCFLFLPKLHHSCFRASERCRMAKAFFSAVSVECISHCWDKSMYLFRSFQLDYPRMCHYKMKLCSHRDHTNMR